MSDDIYDKEPYEFEVNTHEERGTARNDMDFNSFYQR